MKTELKDASNFVLLKVIMEFSLGNLIFLIQLVIMMTRICQNAHLSELRKKTQFFKRFGITLLCIFIIILTMVFMIVEAFMQFIPEFWLNQYKFTTISQMIQILVLFFQAYLLYFELKKEIPPVWYIHKLFWILICFAYGWILLHTIMNTIDRTIHMVWALVCDLFRFIAAVILMLVGIIQQNQVPDFEENINNPLLAPLIEIKNERSLSMEFADKKKLKSPAKMSGSDNLVGQLQLEDKTENELEAKLYKFLVLPLQSEGKEKLKQKIEMRHPAGIEISIRDENEIKIFWAEMLKLGFTNFSGSIQDSFGNVNLEIFEKMLNKLNEQLINQYEFIAKFLNLNEMKVQALFSQKNEDMIIEEVKGQERAKTQEEVEKIDFKHCIYFKIQATKQEKRPDRDQNEFYFTLRLTENPFEKWEIVKRFNDFIKLQKDMAEHLRVELPDLPKKLFLLDKISLESRKEKLEDYMKIILNDPIYFCPILFNFISLKEENKKYLQVPSFQLSNFIALIRGHTVKIDNNKKPQTAYIIDISEQNPDGKIQATNTILKRFSEFVDLHNSLLSRYAQSELPALPPKISAFQNRTSKDERKIGLEIYLNGLFKVPKIENSFNFLRFIDFDVRKEHFTNVK